MAQVVKLKARHCNTDFLQAVNHNGGWGGGTSELEPNFCLNRVYLCGVVRCAVKRVFLLLCYHAILCVLSL